MDETSEKSKMKRGYFQYMEVVSDMELKKILLEIKASGTAMEKIQAISLLGAIKLFYV